MSSLAISSVSNRSAAGIFDCEVPATREAVLISTDLCYDVAAIVIEYLKNNDNPFGKEEFIEILGVNPVRVPELSKAFYTWWYEPDALEPEKLNCETHIPPVYRPPEIGDPQTLDTMAISFKTLKFLGLGYAYEGDAFNQNQNKEADSGCWLVMRKEVFARNQTPAQQFAFIKELNEKTGSRYEEKPSAIDLAFVVFARYAFKGERHLGDDTGEEKRWTYSRCLETVKYENAEYPLVVGGFAPGALRVRSDVLYVRPGYGVAGLRKF